MTPRPTPVPQQTPPAIRVVRHADVRHKLNISGSALFALIAAGRFPKPFTLFEGGRAVGWLETDIDAWLLARVRTAEGETV